MAALRPTVFVITVDQTNDPRDDGAWGEAQRWFGGGIDQPVAVPGLDFPMFHDRDGRQCLIITGLAKTNCAISVTAAVVSGLVDLRDAHILIAGIGGCNPEHASTGSVAWSRWVVDGGLASIVPQDELPPEFEFPYFPLGCTTPWCTGEKPLTVGTEMYQLNEALAAWAVETTQDLELADSDYSKRYRAQFVQTEARRAPFVLVGDAIGSDTWFHGERLGNWASQWMRYWTNERGKYVVTDLEDCAFVAALSRFGKAGFLDFQKVLLDANGGHIRRRLGYWLSHRPRPFPSKVYHEGLHNGAIRQTESLRIHIVGPAFAYRV